MREQLTRKDVEKIEQEIEHRKLVVRKEAIEAVKEARAQGETDGKIFTPVEGGKQVLRGIITREEAERLIDEIPSIETLSIENEKFREDSYKKCIRTCECRDLLRIIKTIYVRKQARLSHGKKTTATDERYLKLAEDHLYSEFSMLLDIPKEHMADYIEQRVHQQKEAEEQVCAV